ncbi:Cleavage stimulation factor subunit 50 [Capsicum chinense]|nr:Cleavage stimulation factor subunit 50 [Capsicum chinense]
MCSLVFPGHCAGCFFLSLVDVDTFHSESVITYGMQVRGLAASAVASATMTPMNVEARPNKLLELVAKGLAVEKEETVRGGVSTAVPFDPIITGYGSIPTPRAASVDFRQFISHHTFFLTS